MPAISARRARKERQRQRRLKELERKLRSAAHQARRVEGLRTQAQRHALRAAEGEASTIGPKAVRKLFGVSRSTWKRWRRFGWLPACTRVDGKTRYRISEIGRLVRQCGKVEVRRERKVRIERTAA